MQTAVDSHGGSRVPPGRYDEQLHSSHFGFAPRGDALFSYRFSELAAAGVLPIVLSDGWALPFRELIDWDSIALRVPEGEVASVPSMLSHLSLDEVCARRLRLFDVYHRYLADPGSWARLFALISRLNA